jgi:hypothetical protein
MLAIRRSSVPENFGLVKLRFSALALPETELLKLGKEERQRQRLMAHERNHPKQADLQRGRLFLEATE